MEQNISLREFQEMVQDNVRMIELESKVDNMISNGDYVGGYNLLKQLNAISYKKKCEYRDICAANGVDEAQYELALVFYEKEENLDMAFIFFRRLAEKRYIPAYYYLGMCYFYGLGCEKNKGDAEDYIFKAWIFSEDYSDEKDNMRKFINETIFVKSTDRIAGRADFRCLGELFLEENYREIYRIMASEYVNCTDPFTGFLLADLFLSGKGVQRDSTVAIELLRQTCYYDTDYDYDPNYYYDGRVPYTLGKCLYSGIGVKESKEIASYFFDLAIDSCDETSLPVKFINEINDAREMSESVFRDTGCDYTEEAIEWLENSLEKYACL